MPTTLAPSRLPYYREQDLVAMVSVLPCAAFVERAGRLIAWNESAAALCGIDQLTNDRQANPEPVSSGQVFLGAFPFEPSTPNPFATKGPKPFDCALLRQDGRMIAVRGALRVFDTDTGPARLITVSEQAFGEKASEGEGTLLGELLDAAPEAIAITHEGRLLYVNHEFINLFQYDIDDCLGKPLDELLTPHQKQTELARLYAQLETEGRASLDTLRLDSHGSEIDVSLLVGRVRLSGEVFGLFYAFRDIRPQKQAEAMLHHRAMHDVLTGLANRSLFTDRTQVALKRLHREINRHFAVMFLDLDGFKVINDTLGHDAGDKLLLEISRSLRNAVRPQDTLARMGGDEFAILLEETSSLALIERIAERLHAAIVAVGIEGLHVAVSIGVTFVTSTGATAARVLREADIAMYQAKSEGRARTIFFAPGMTMKQSLTQQPDSDAA